MSLSFCYLPIARSHILILELSKSCQYLNIKTYLRVLKFRHPTSCRLSKYQIKRSKGCELLLGHME